MASSRDSFAVAEQHCDLTGLLLTCRSDKALEWYNKALIAHVTYREDPLPFATRALELDDSLLLGHCLVVISVDAKHHGARLSERWNVIWVGNNSICTHNKITTL